MSDVLAARDGGVSRNRRIAMAVKDPQHLALDIGGQMRGGIVDQRERAPRLPVARRAFHGDDPLPRRRKHLARRELMGHARAKADALKPRPRHDERIRWTHCAAIGQSLQFAVVELAHAGIGRAANE